MVDVGGYVIILLKTKDRKIKLYGSFADKEDLKIDDEILDVNGHTLSNATRSQAIAHINQCIKSRVICLRCRHTPQRPEIDLNNVQDAFVIAVEPQARERLERLATLYKIQPVDMAKLCQQLNRPTSFVSPATCELNGFVDSCSSSNQLTNVFSATLNADIRSADWSSKSPRKEVVTSISLKPLDNQIVANSETKSFSSSSTNVADTDFGAASIADRGGTCNSKRVDGVSSSAAAVAAKVDVTAVAADRNLSSFDNEEPLESWKNRRVSLCVPGTADREPQVRKSRRASSPFTNGGTELLIGQHDEHRLKTTAIIEDSRRSQRNTANRDRKSDTNVIENVNEFVARNENKKISSNNQYDTMMMVMAAVDNGPHRDLLDDIDSGPHRELPVDVPDTFIARNKTPPRYPPPKPKVISMNGTAHKSLTSQRENPPRVPPVPVSPPRFVSTVVNNNNISIASKEPTEEQLNNIKKYQEALRKRKEEEERLAQEVEFLNRSLRGSKKLQALEASHVPTPPSGIDNTAYADYENYSVHHTEAEHFFQEEIHKILNYGELFASLQRLQLHLRKAGINGKILEPVHCLLQNQYFHRALSIHNKVHQVWWSPSKHKKPITSDAKSLITECLKDLQNSCSPEAAKLTEFLARNEVEELLEAHDTIVRNFFPDTVSDISSLIISAGELMRTSCISQDPNIRIIKIDKTNEPLGATVRNDGDAVIIGRVVKGGAAEKCGLLHEGDELLEVNGIEMRGKSVNEVCDILSAMSGLLTFYINPCSVSRTTNYNKDTVVVYVRALFDYDAEDDLYVPCRELGISFQKGDILIVKSQEDPNWWQADRYGEHDHSLAGLIPSKTFQQQREALKQTISGERIGREKSRKAGTFLCGKNLKKKRKKSPYQTYQDGGYPLYSSSSADEYDAEEIPTYEEVIWYYPSMNHKRPVVLIGPPNIGRHELRQRLMEDSDRFAAAVPHTSRARKEGEMDGQDYHFITRSQFEADILSRKFVEHGEYEKAYYGTSLEAIRSVVNCGKICVLNLHAQSLKILRNSDLMPYVVFVAPPSLEKLRLKRIKSGDAFKEDELKEIIEKARDMEDKYGHYFDMIIINNDMERAYHELLHEINKVEREPQWIPASWVREGHVRYMNPHVRNAGPYYRSN